MSLTWEKKYLLEGSNDLWTYESEFSVAMPKSWLPVSILGKFLLIGKVGIY